LTIIKQSEAYQAIASNGLSKFHKVTIEVTEDEYFLVKEWWSVKQDGTESIHQFSVPKLIKAKNVGKANETSLYDQALSEYESTLLRYLDKGYHLEGQEVLVEVLPMLAKTLNLDKFNTFPCYIQPKYDGCRALQSSANIYSRKGKPYIGEVIKHLKLDIPDGLYLDGELMLPPPYSFQDTMKAIKKYDPEVSQKLMYIVYDCYDAKNPLLNLTERLSKIERLLTNNLESVIVCPTLQAHSIHEIEYHFSEISKTHEGIMVRLNEPYAVGQRSSSLLKHKDFLDSEYEIIDIVEGEGSYKGCGIFVCKTLQDIVFNVTPKTSIEDKKEIFNNKQNYIGKQLKVKYQNLSDTGVPRFPVGLIREDIEG
jgi:DNA ligase-1